MMALAAEYFYARIWAAPAAIGIFSLHGWLTGMQDTITPMVVSIVNNIINNFSAESRRRVDWSISIAYGDDYDVARAAILEILAADERIEKDPAPFVALGSLGDSAVNITVRVWAKSSDYWGIYHDTLEKVYKQLPAKGINFPFPQMDVHITK
jgi:small conductance mechanosensitive channel